jgi:hypothetical protein
VIGEPPFDAGVVNDTVACPLPGDAVPIVGAPGIVNGVTLAVPDAGPVPTALVAVTEQFTVMPAAKPPTVIEGPAPETLCVPQVAV